MTEVIEMSEVDGVFVEGSGGSSSKNSGVSSAGGVEAPNTLQNNTFAMSLDLISEGPIQGLYGLVATEDGGGGQNDAGYSIYLNNVPIKSPDTSQNFSGIQWETVNGYPGQATLLNVNTVSNEVEVNTPVTQEVGPIVRTITDSSVNAVRITIEIPALYHLFTSSGDIDGTDLELTIEVQTGDGDYSVVVDDHIVNQKCTSPYERSYVVALGNGEQGQGPWNIRVTRITPDSTDSNLVNAFEWVAYTELTYGNFPYNNCAVVATQFNAQLFGTSVPVRSYDTLGLIVDVPSNYDPIARSYSGVWDGTFKQAWTNNPVWVLFDLLLNTRYGLGQRISFDNIDTGSFYTAAQYCDGAVQDGAGGYEARYTFNAQILQQQDAYKVLQSVASSFRGILFWTSGTIYLKADMPTNPSALIVPANVIDGKFTYSGSAMKSRHTVALVTFKDPTNNYEDTVEFVVDNAGIRQLGYRQTNVVAFGCTSRGQAHRTGEWILDTERTQTETVVWQASFDNCFLKPGDVVNVADPGYAGVRYGGRIVDYQSNTPANNIDTITLDATINLDPGETWMVQFVKQDMTITAPIDIIEVSGPSNQLTVVGQTDVPLNNAVWIITSSNVYPRQFQVQSIREASRGIVEVTALFYDPTKYARVEGGIITPLPPYAYFPTTPPPAPTNLAVTETDYIANGVAVSRLTFSWSPSTDVLAFQYGVYYEDPSGQVKVLPLTSQFNVSIDPASLGDYTFYVYVLTSDNRQSTAASISATCDGKTSAPALPIGISASGGSHQISINWTNPNDLDFAYIEVWASQTNDIGTATLIGTAAGGSYVQTGLANNATWHYWLKSVDQSGNKSAYTSPSVSATTVYVLANDIANALLTTAAFAQSISAPTPVEGLPDPTTWGGSSIVYNIPNGILYELEPGPPKTWQALYPDGGSNTPFDYSEVAFALGINIPAVVSTLPATGQEGQTVTLTTNGMLYRWHDGAWTDNVDGASVLPGTITTTQIADGAITTPLLAANSVTAANIEANTITAAQIAAGAIGASEIAAGAITTAAIAAGAITAGTIAAGAIGASQIAAGAIRGTNIAANTITGSNIEANSVDCSVLSSSTIEASNIYLSQTGSTNFNLHSADDGDGYGPYLRISDGTWNRIMIGRVNNDYGIEIRDNTGNLVIEANGTLGIDVIGSSQLQNTSVDTNHMVANAITGVGSNTGSTGTSTNSWVTVASVTMSVIGYAQMIWASASTSANSTYDIQFSIAIDGTQVQTWTLNSGAMFSVTLSVTGTSAGAHSFDLQVASASGHAIGFTTPNIIVMDAKA